ncbi:MAG: amino acid deaminase/aldolase [Frankia sp.]
MTTNWKRIETATAALDPPFAVVDGVAFDANAADLADRAGGRPIRVATKSVRSRALLRRALERPGFAGVLAYSLAEAVWLAEALEPQDGPIAGTGAYDRVGHRPDVVVGYPTADQAALRALVTNPTALRRITLMVDSVDQLDLIDNVVGSGSRPDHPDLRICIDMDASLRFAAGRVHIGVLRSPVHTAREAAALARAVVERPGRRLVGVMAYEAQIAGVGDDPPGPRGRAIAVRAMQAVSRAELRRRRQAVITAVRAVSPLEFVNGGGTGSVERTAREPAVTEVAAGSGLYGPTLFDAYRAFSPRAAALFALPVVRRPGPGVVTVAGGGWIASGPIGADRAPVPVHPAGLNLVPLEGAGEVQTPLRGAAADQLRVGDRVWFRHAKAGELCEHVNELHVIEADGSVRTVTTYRGDGKAF